MGEKDFLVDAVAQFLQTNEWQEAITHFFAAHVAQFASESAEEKQSKGVGYTLEQFDVFTQFKDLMERLLETMMGELGCNGEDLVAILQESVRNGPTGERRFLIKTLLSFEDYVDFHARITEYAAQQQQQNRTQGDTAERSEWEMQLAVAQSLLDANAQGLLDEAELSFLPWAEALVGMGHSNPVADQLPKEMSESKEEFSSEPREAVDGASERLKELEYTLIKERLKVDLLVAQRIAEANSVMKKDMLHLSAVEVVQSEEHEGVAAEHSLQSLFALLEKVRDRLKAVKTRCFEFKNVNQEAMDKMYLFLKEKVHYQQDLVSQGKEIADFIFGLIEQSDAPLIPLLLEWLLLESEALRVQGQIQEELGQGASEPNGITEGDGFWTQSWDENAQAFFYFHSVTGESVWEPPSVGFYDANQEYHVPEPVTDGSNDTKGEEKEGKVEPRTPQDLNTTCLYQVASELDDKISASTAENPTDMYEMERVLERISREHDEERKRLELVFELEKARQKEELRRRKEKKRREKQLKKKKKDGRRREDESTDYTEGAQELRDEKRDEDQEVTPQPPLLSVLSSPREKAEGKDADNEDSHLSIPIPGRGRLDLAHLLSEEHAKRQLERNGLTVPLAPAPQALLNPTSLRYLAETLAKKNIGGCIDQSPKSSRQLPPPVIELEEVDEK